MFPELRTQRSYQPDLSELQTSLNACFEELDESLSNVPEVLESEKRGFLTLGNAIEEFELASTGASEIGVRMFHADTYCWYRF